MGTLMRGVAKVLLKRYLSVAALLLLAMAKLLWPWLLRLRER